METRTAWRLCKSKYAGSALSDPAGAQAFGKKWVDEQRTVALDVPSVVAEVGGERNVILNPRHARFDKAVKIGKPRKLSFDPLHFG